MPPATQVIQVESFGLNKILGKLSHKGFKKSQIPKLNTKVPRLVLKEGYINEQCFIFKSSNLAQLITLNRRVPTVTQYGGSNLWIVFYAIFVVCLFGLWDGFSYINDSPRVLVHI